MGSMRLKSVSKRRSHLTRLTGITEPQKGHQCQRDRHQINSMGFSIKGTETDATKLKQTQNFLCLQKKVSEIVSKGY